RSGVTKVIYRVDAAVPVDHHLTQIDVHPTEPWILASHRRGGVSIWNYETQERVMTLKNLAPTDMMRSVKFIARKRWFMAGDFHGWIHVHSFAMNDEVTKFKGHDGAVISLVVHPSDPLVVSSSVDRHIKLWNWKAGWRCVRKLKAHLNNVEKVLFNPWDSNCLASVGNDNMLKIWKISSPLPVTILDCDEHQLTVDYFHPGGDRQYIVTGSVSGKARVYMQYTWIFSSSPQSVCVSSVLFFTPPDLGCEDKYVHSTYQWAPNWPMRWCGTSRLSVASHDFTGKCYFFVQLRY
uniref:Uncharacterized protein n=2 Tax=Aegilops tauschii subsp. strangulata TaxID=200361 RepID=A0A453MV57_AEGTS